MPAEESALRIMIPVNLLALLPSFRSLPEKRVLWGTSQMPSGRCDNFKNRAFAIEPRKEAALADEDLKPIAGHPGFRRLMEQHPPPAK